MSCTLVGFVRFQSKAGKECLQCFFTERAVRPGLVGEQVMREFLPVATQLDKSHIGKPCSLVYRRGYDGSAVAVSIQFAT